MSYAFTHANLVDGTEGMICQPDCTVLVDGDRIVSIQDGATPAPDGYEVIDLSGRYLMPGLINLHSHQFGIGKPAKSLSSGLSQNILVGYTKTAAGRNYLDQTAEHALHQMLMSGVTTVRGAGDLTYSDVRTRDKIKSGTIDGPRFICSGPAMTTAHGHGAGTFATIDNAPSDFALEVADRIAHGVDFIKICITSGVMDSTVKGEAGIMRMSADQVASVIRAAHAAGFKVASHTLSTEGVQMCAEQGVDTIEHGSGFDETTAEMLKANGSAIVSTISVALPLAYLATKTSKMTPIGQYNANLVLDRLVQGVQDARAYGVTLGLGTDAACPFMLHYDTWRELYNHVKYAGATPAQIINTATLSNARIIGLGDETGSIEAGKCADMIVVEKNPLEHISTLRNVKMVMARGKLFADPQVEHLEKLDEVLDTLL